MGEECSIQFEWPFGATHDVVLGHMLDPVFGVDGEIALLCGQTVDDCYSGSEVSIALRRAVWGSADGHGAAGIAFGQARRQYRADVEKKYGY